MHPETKRRDGDCWPRLLRSQLSTGAAALADAPDDRKHGGRPHEETCGALLLRRNPNPARVVGSGPIGPKNWSLAMERSFLAGLMVFA